MLCCGNAVVRECASAVLRQCGRRSNAKLRQSYALRMLCNELPNCLTCSEQPNLVDDSLD